MIHLRALGIGTVLLDIEGTTTPIAFVHDTLFPYARRHLRELILEVEMSSPGRAWIDQLHAEWRAEQPGADALPEWKGNTVEEIGASALAYCEWLMDRDRKSTALKTLQGLIWDRGYRAGDLESEVYPDVPRALRTWAAAGIEIGIYSSGSVQAQKLLFGATKFGDLKPYLRAHFDTAVGSKRDAASYRSIAESLHRKPDEILFVSDVVEELQAARVAGLQVVLSKRPGNPAQPDVAGLETITTLDELTAGPSTS